jgi:hypothetical protein
MLLESGITSILPKLLKPKAKRKGEDMHCRSGGFKKLFLIKALDTGFRRYDDVDDVPV